MAAADTSREDDELADAQEAYQRAKEAWADNYDLAREDFRFARLSEQWPEELKRQRELEHRPCLTINRLPSFIRQVVNDGRQNKPAITVHPVDDAADPETAEVFNGLIRHIEQSSDADVAYDTALDHAVTGGFGFFKINTRYATDEGFEQDIVIEPVANAFSVLPDPDSTAADSSDWNEAWETEALSKRAFERLFPDADAVSFDEANTWRKGLKDDDCVNIAYRWTREQAVRRIVALKPTQQLAEDEQSLVAPFLSESLILDVTVYEAQKDLFDALGFVQVGQPRDVPTHSVRRCTYSGADLLEELPWAGRWIPIVPVYGEDINLEGQRHLAGLVRMARDPQLMFNFWRTMSTELVALAPKTPYIGKAGSFDTDRAKWDTANTLSHPFIEYDGELAPQRQTYAGIPAGAIQEALNASDDMKSIMGLFDASLGARSNETSGKAILARQREGDVGTFHYIDNLSRAIRHAGRILLDLIPKVYGTARVIRILGPDGEQQAVRIAPSAEAQQQPPVMDEAGKIAPIYTLDVGKYDLTVQAGPSFTSRREEAASQMIEMIRAYPAVAPIIGDLLAKNLDWPGADEIADRLKAMLPAQLQGENPEAEAAKAQMQKMAQIIGQLRGELEAAKADKDIARGKLEVEQFNAETSRLKAIAPKGVAVDPNEAAPLVTQVIEQLLNDPDVLGAAASGADTAQLGQMIAQRMQAPQQQQQQPPAQAA